MNDVVFYPAANSGPQGPQGDPGPGAYQQAVDAGFTGTLEEWLASLKGDPGDPGSPGSGGASAFELAVAAGFSGTEAEWLASLSVVGPAGADGMAGSPGEPGNPGASAFALAVDAGFVGTLEEWLASLKGDPGTDGASAFELAVAAGFSGTEAEWLASLSVEGPAGPQGDPGADGLSDAQYVVSKAAEPGHYASIQDAISAAETAGTSARIVVWPGTYTENLTISKPHIHIQAAVNGRSFSTTLNGTLTYTAAATQVCTWVGIDIAAGSATALSISGTNRAIIIVEDCSLTGGSSSVPTISSANTNSLSDLILNRVRVMGTNATTALSSTCGRLKVTDSEVVAATNGIAVSINNTVAGGFSTITRFETIGRIVIAGTAPAYATLGTVNAGTGYPIVHSGTGMVSIGDLVLYTSQAEVAQVTSTGVLTYGGTINWASALQSLPAAAVKAPGAPVGTQGPQGDPGADGLSAFELAVAGGFVGTEAEWLASLAGPQGNPGDPGASAFELAVAAGFVGTEAEWLASLKGDPGDPGADGLSAYAIAVASGFSGTEAEWLASLSVEGPAGVPGQDGQDGASAYAVAVASGFTGTEAEWLASLSVVGPQGDPGADGLSAFELAVAGGFVGTEAEWLAGLSVVGPQGDPGADGLSAYAIAVASGFSGTEGEWLASLSVAGPQGDPGADGLSAFELAVAAGFVGTESEWLASLVGAAGSDGVDGSPGEPGPGVAAGGLAGQVLAKTSSEVDYATAWVDATLNALGDTTVDSQTLADGQVLTYNATSEQWENTTPNTGGATTLDELTDVVVSSPQWGQIMYYDGSTSTWKNEWAPSPNQVTFGGYNPSTTDAIPAMSAVYCTAVVDGEIHIAPASNADTTGEKVYAVTFNEIGTQSGGGVCLSGVMFGVATYDWAAGDVLWLGTNGQITNVEPTGATSLVRIGVVLAADSGMGNGEGRVLIRPEVGVPGPAGEAGVAGPQGDPGPGVAAAGSLGQVLVKASNDVDYVTTWVDPTVDALSDASITSPADGQVLTYDSTTSQWVNEAAPSPASGYMMGYPYVDSNAIELPPRWMIGTQTGGGIAGTVYGSVFVAPDARTVNSVYFYIDTWSSTSITSYKMALYRKTGASEWTRVGVTATNHSNTATGVRELALTAPVTLVKGDTYAIATLGVGNAPTMYRLFNANTAISQHGVQMAWEKTSQTDMPATITSPSTYTSMLCGGTK